MKHISESNKGLLFCIFSGMLYGPLGYFGVNVLAEGLSITNMLLWRFTVSCAFISIILLPKIKFIKFDLNILIGQLIIGMLTYGPFSYFYFKASTYIGTGLAMVIFFTFPAFVMLFRRIIYKTKVPRIYNVSMCVIFCGLLLLMEADEIKADLRGIGLAMISSALYAVYIVASNSRSHSSPPLVSCFSITIGAILSYLFLANLDDSFFIPTSFVAWQNLIGIGLIATAIPTVFLLQGMKYVSAEKASILSVLEPVIVLLIGVSALGEEINFLQTIGAFVIITGAFLVQIDRRKNGTHQPT